MKHNNPSAQSPAEGASVSPAPHLITVDATHRVSALLLLPPAARACFVMAHGAGAGMEHPSMETLATELYALQIATLRYQFPYMERGSRRPDRPELCHATVRAAVAEAARLAPDLPLIAGGRSFGGRMTSQAQAICALPGVRGLAFLAFPLHPADRPSNERAEHLFEVKIPMLFLQGTRDALADLKTLRDVVKRLGKRATLKLLEDADHSFHVPARTGRKDPQVRSELLHALADWSSKLGTPGACLT
jgi:predicted alpha/beta-hydrolase family hydrolase